MKECILLRYGEMGLKSRKTKPFFEKLLVRAIEDAMRKNGMSATIKNQNGRFILTTDTIVACEEVLIRVPGLQSFSRATQFEFDSKEDLITQVQSIAQLWVKNQIYAVRAKRSGMHSFGSVNIAKEIGDSLYEQSKGVNLKNPQVWVNVEIRDQTCYVFSGQIKGLGGLPPTSAGRVLALFSGGIDSPVAAYTMMKRGCGVDFLYINMLGDSSFNQIAQIYNFLCAQYAYGYVPKLHVVNGKALVEKIQKEVPNTMRQIALKIAFYKIGEAVAKQQNLIGCVTGEALSQKSSQTLQSLALIQQQIQTLVIRPLIGQDKLEIIETARKIGTFAYSEKVKELCNLSDGPVTTSPIAENLTMIPNLDDMIKAAVDSKHTHKGLIEIEEKEEVNVGSEFTVIDIRQEHLRKQHPIDADIEIAYPQIIDEIPSLDKKKKYLIVCDFGVQSEEVAFQLQSSNTTAAGIALKNYLKYFSHLRSKSSQ